MRIIQLSDIHLNNENITDLQDYYREALIKDIRSFHDVAPIDIILLTGDLVDMGGNSLGIKPYEIFTKEIIDPLMKEFGLLPQQILFIPGNHDIDRTRIENFTETGLAADLDKDLANDQLKKMKDTFTIINGRIETFKTFERDFHKDNPAYRYSNNESATIFEKNGHKIGFALVNDSWRCSSTLLPEQHFIGANQLFNAKRYFSENQTQLNVAVFHHPLNAINHNESDEIDNILQSQGFNIAFFGHSHKHEAKHLSTAIGGYLVVNGRAAFNQPKEGLSKFQPGYSILDVDVNSQNYTLHARKFIRDSGFRFASDVDSLPEGIMQASLPSRASNYEFVPPENSNNIDTELPNSYSADVHRIVKLLIGKSLYSEPYAFARELIQNSVDANNRLKRKKTHLVPKIRIIANSEENYLEVADEGDGMTKRIIKEHFSVIGKSISQDFNESNDNFELISKFGIGFISTFIAAEKVVIDTKNDDDEQVIFEIADVFSEFVYVTPTGDQIRDKSGTIVRVYLKKGFDPRLALDQTILYCRHIENLEIIRDKRPVALTDNWNLDNAAFCFQLTSDRYELKLGLSLHGRSLIASNSGFLITPDPPAILPFRFPVIIGGEINFYPKSIDFDMSRTKIMESKKSDAVRKEISIGLKSLFTQGLESGDPNLIQSVTNYLQYYLQHYDANLAMVQQSYPDFYTKRELIDLCSKYMIMEYMGNRLPLSYVLMDIKRRSLNKIFFYNTQSLSDYQVIVIQYLENQGFLVVKNRSFSIAFRGSNPSVSTVSVLQQISQADNIPILDISHAHEDVLKDMKMEKASFDRRLQDQIMKVEHAYSVKIEIGKFSRLPKPSIHNGDQIFLNHDHATFQSLLKNLDIAENVFEIYLLGLLGLQLKS